MLATVKKSSLIIALTAFMCLCGSCTDSEKTKSAEIVHRVVTSDTLLSGMIASLLPVRGYNVEAILPPGQCPGHYDVKLSDIEKMRTANLMVSFKGMSFMDKTRSDGASQVLIDANGRNWMAPNSYAFGLELLAEELSKRFPEERTTIMARKQEILREVTAEARLLAGKVKQAGLSGKSVITSSMQKEPVEWMGFRVAAQYGRPEAMSAREIVHVVKTGKDERAILVIDNLQSGPDTGKGIAEALKIPHVVLTNFPSEKGYLPSLRENVDSVIRAATGM